MSAIIRSSEAAARLETQSQVASEDFKLSMRCLAGAVSVITVGRGADRTGFTATSVSSLSADRPSVIVSLDRGSSSWPVVERYGRFCVNVLAQDQSHVADAFAGRGGERGAERYNAGRWIELETGSFALADALTFLDCNVDSIIEYHTHSIVIGRVISLGINGFEPLLYWSGRFRRLNAADHTG